MNDLWVYENDTWTWISGSSADSSTGRYESKGVPSTTAVPSARQSSVLWCNTTHLYLFGGSCCNSSSCGTLCCSSFFLFSTLQKLTKRSGGRLANDLWRHEYSTSTWTWLTGGTTGNDLGLPGVMGLRS